MPIYRLTSDLIFPPPHLAEDGLLAVEGDLSKERLLLAYRSGIFPWYSEDDPVIWWAPDPRMVLFPEEMHISRRLIRTVRSGRYALTMNRAFGEVITACAAVPRRGQDGTWIMPEMIAAYTDLHTAGYAHSIECWRGGELAGGLYGVALGRCLFGESMFSRQRDASKVVMAALCLLCDWLGIALIDCQVANDHLRSLGAREIPRRSFMKLLSRELPRRGIGPPAIPAFPV
jgi:leucyl/phenylalanyl-tRNA---protein transferase